jgi:threonine/homoserine/homoserine lactone efflux protein
VMALYVTVFAGTAPIGGLLAGALAQAFGAPVAFSVGAALGAGVLAFVAWNLRAREPEAQADMAAAPRALELDRRAA